MKLLLNGFIVLILALHLIEAAQAIRKVYELKNNKSDKIEEIVENEQKPTKRPTDFQKCLTGEYSDPQNNDTVTFESKTCTNQVDECYTHVTNNVIRKGCLSDAKNFLSSGIDIETDCKNPDICEKCSGSIDCNHKNIQKEFCTVCDSENEPDCKFWPTYIMRNQCPLSIRPFGCLTLINGSTVQRDCMSNDSKLRELCLSKNESCKHCFGDECNKDRSVLLCRNCNSAQDGENCKNRSYSIRSENCKTFMDECFTHINDDGIVTRGCLNDFESIKKNCTNDDTCLRCNNSEIVCNGNSIKAEWCISCDSADSPNCKSNVLTSNSSTICPQKTIQRLGCYHFINELDGHTKRGCISTLNSEDRTLALKQLNGWKICNDYNNCNSKNNQIQVIDPTFSCHKCNDSEGCSFGLVSDDTIVKCNISIISGLEESCYTRVLSDDSVERGCTLDASADGNPNWCKDIENCNECKGHGCNNENVQFSYCLRCDSTDDVECKNLVKTPGTFKVKCTPFHRDNNSVSDNVVITDLFDPYPFVKRGCYTINKGDAVQRGCLIDLDDDKLSECRDNPKWCGICENDYCNDQGYTSSSSTNLLSSFSLLFCAITLLIHHLK